MKNFTVFLISIIALLAPHTASACAYDAPERWYMFCFSDEPFRDKFDKENDAFWRSYCGKNGEEWISEQDRIDAATTKGDKSMLEYIQQLDIYTDICRDLRDTWTYPTAEERSARTAALRRMASLAEAMRDQAHGDRWLLLQMRANMLLGNYEANKTLWKKAASKLPKSTLREMMRNIYANALLNTGAQREAWDIYADQNDRESLVWTVRKFSNLAGIKRLQATTPNAKVTEYLLERYVNNVQDILDGYDDFGPDYSGPDCEESAFACISPNYMTEIREFVDFATSTAKSSSTDNPALWMTAAALVTYYLHDYAAADRLIDQALNLKGPESVKKMARRSKMLIHSAAADINSKEFKEWMANELNWLASDIAATKSVRAEHAYDRILNLGLRKRYQQAGDHNLAIAIEAHRQRYNPAKDYGSAPQPYDEHGSDAFDELYALSPEGILAYFDYAANPGDDPLARYFTSTLKYSPEYVNDVVGTRYIQEGDYATALTYLDKVPLDYLNDQAIALYALRRDYRTPAWDRFQKVGDYSNNIPDKISLKRNIKSDYCRDMITLQNKYRIANPDERKKLALTIARNLYQALPCGQCWFITQYFNSSYQDPNDVTTQAAVSEVNRLLNEAATSSDYNTKARAQFALSFIAPDSWCDTRFNYHLNKYETTYNPTSEQYERLLTLTRTLNQMADEPYEVSHCDVIKRFRRHRASL